MDRRTPVLVGAATAQDDESDALELMWKALHAAAASSGGRGLLRRIGLVLVPRGSWTERDPGRVLAGRAGAATARTVVAEAGILQQTLLNRAATAILAGQADVIAVVGGEAKTGPSARVFATTEDGAPPDEVWRPDGDIISRLEIERGLGIPARQYAVIDNALRWATGQTVEQQSDALGQLWAGMSRVAAANPDAWDRHAWTPDEIVTVGPGNRMIATPYTKRLCSQWNVRQAAALLLCAAETASGLGVPKDRWVFPVSSAESNTMIPLSARAALADCSAFALVGAHALQRVGLTIGDIEFIDLYSCFPAAVRVQQRELAVDVHRPVTVTGGMTFGGGPLNNYVLQSTAKLASILLEHPSSHGMVTAVSGMLTKQAAAVWTARPPSVGFGCDDVSLAAADATASRQVVPDFVGRGTVASYTVGAGRDGPIAVAIVDAPDGKRTIVTAADPDTVEAFGEGEWCGQAVSVDGPRLRISD